MTTDPITPDGVFTIDPTAPWAPDGWEPLDLHDLPLGDDSPAGHTARALSIMDGDPIARHTGISNFTGRPVVDPGVEQRLLATRGSVVWAAVNHNSWVWHDDDGWAVRVGRHHEGVETWHGPELMPLLEAVSDRWGWE